ncbi:glutathione transferase GST 23-like [Ziziphus jujuba]|uniref:Glutathione S-transferase n=1 Tax=Ziziphus jujuba TaxID=326968 RepID=A0ABM4A5A6_ZIZJJ|nr:glutathione transferase GST 23-like [Ziziphus jujuba]
MILKHFHKLNHISQILLSEMSGLKLHGAWVSPFVFRVKWALKLKGIPFEYIEEDLYNKSKMLLHYNPIHKKVPVLVHGGKPICESMLIIEYIEETWPQNPLLPNDPYEKALARFWVKFADDKGPAVFKVYKSRGEELEKAKEESLEILRTVEKHGLGDKKFFGGEEIGIVDIAFGWMVHWLGAMEEVGGVKLLESDEFPRLHAWINNFKEVHVIKENLPDHHDLVAHLKVLRERLLGQSSS